MAKHAKSLSGRVAVVTGAASGIGRALAEELARRGARLALLDANESGLTQVASRLEALALPCDVRDEAAVAKVAARVRDELGAPHLLFANAGVATVGPTLDVPIADIRWVVDVNLIGTMIVAQQFLPEMVAAGRGHVAFTASIAGLIGAPGMAAYTASKFGVVGMAESLRLELLGSGVTVTTVCPGFVRTGLHAATRYHGAAFAGFLDRAPSWAGLGADAVARRSIDATLRGTPMLTLGVEAAATWLKRLSPSVYVSLAARASRRAGLFAGARAAATNK